MRTLILTTASLLVLATQSPAQPPTELDKIRQELRQLEEKRVRLQTQVRLAESFKRYWENERDDLFRRDLAALAVNAGLRAAEWAGKQAQYEGDLAGVEARVRELRAKLLPATP